MDNQIVQFPLSSDVRGKIANLRGGGDLSICLYSVQLFLFISIVFMVREYEYTVLSIFASPIIDLAKQLITNVPVSSKRNAILLAVTQSTPHRECSTTPK